MSRHSAEILLAMIGVAAAVGLVVAGLVYAGTARRSRRYRPGRPFTFVPVWFVSAPERQARTGTVAPSQSITAGRSTPAGPGAAARAGAALRRGETGGASDRW